MNIHHLELFYYVAKHGGIAAAVRKMPYGIQQPAVSGQIARPNYYGVFAGAFRFSAYNFTRQREQTPRDCCKQEKSIWRSR